MGIKDFFMPPEQPPTTRPTTSPAATVDPKFEVMQKLTLRSSYIKTDLNIMMAVFTIHNGSYWNVQDVVVTCALYAPSGTMVGKKSQAIYEIFEAGETKKTGPFNMGFIDSQTSSVYCSITDLVL